MMSKGFTFKEPPDKRRRVETSIQVQQDDDDDDWGDDEMEFTQDDLLTVDSLIMSQAQAPSEVSTTPKQTSSFASNRLVGKSSPRSLSANDLHNNNSRLSMQRKGTKAKPAPEPLRLPLHQKVERPPMAAANQRNAGLVEDLQRKLASISAEAEKYKKDLRAQNDKYRSKDGQIKMLRMTLASKEKELFQQRLERSEYLEKQAKEYKQEQKDLETALDKAKTELQFKGQELLEMQANCKKLEAKSRKLQTSDARPHSTIPIASHAGSKVECPSPSRVDPSSTNGFPTRHTFMAGESSSPVSRKLVKATEEKPKIPCKGESPMRLKSYALNFRTPVKYSKGQVVGSALASLLVPCDGRGEHEGMIGLLHQPPPPPSTSPPALKKRGRHHKPSSSSAEMIDRLTSVLSHGQTSEDHEENVSLARQAFASLLENENAELGAILPLLHTNTVQSTLMLPLIAEQLSLYISALQAMAEMVTAGSDSSQPSSASASLDSLASSLQVLSVEASNYVQYLERQALSALHVLLVLATHCCYVRAALLSCNTRLNSDDAKVEEMEQDKPKESNYQPVPSTSKADVRRRPSATTAAADGSCPTASTSDGHRTLPGSSGARHIPSPCSAARPSRCSLELAMLRVKKDCQILHHLVQLTRMLPYKHGPKTVIVEKCLRILSTLAQSADDTSAERFSFIFSCDLLEVCLAECLSAASSSSVYLDAMQLVTALARFPAILPKFCSQSEDCLLLAIYNLGISNIPAASIKTQLIAKIIQCLGSIVTHHKTGAATLMEADCACSVEVVKCIILMLHHELLQHQAANRHGNVTHYFNPSRIGFQSSPATEHGRSPHTQTLLQGAVLLHSFAVRDQNSFMRNHGDVQHQYVELIHGLNRICSTAYRKPDQVSEIDVHILHDLWDFDDDLPDWMHKGNGTEEETMEEN